MAVSQLQPLLKGIGMARLRFLYGLDRTPDDRLNWSPGGEGKTPLAVAGRLSGFLGFFSHLLETGAMPERPAGPPPSPENREAAISERPLAGRAMNPRTDLLLDQIGLLQRLPDGVRSSAGFESPRDHRFDGGRGALPVRRLGVLDGRGDGGQARLGAELDHGDRL